MKKIEKIYKRVENLKNANLTNQESLRMVSLVEKSFLAIVAKNLKNNKYDKADLVKMMNTNVDLKKYVDNYLQLAKLKKEYQYYVEVLSLSMPTMVSDNYRNLSKTIDILNKENKAYEEKTIVKLFNKKLDSVRDRESRNMKIVPTLNKLQATKTKIQAQIQKNQKEIDKLSNKYQLSQ